MEKPKHSNPATRNMTGALERLFNAITPFPCTLVRFASIISLSPKLTRPLLPQLREKNNQPALSASFVAIPFRQISPASHLPSIPFAAIPFHQFIRSPLSFSAPFVAIPSGQFTSHTRPTRLFAPFAAIPSGQFTSHTRPTRLFASFAAIPSGQFTSHTRPTRLFAPFAAIPLSQLGVSTVSFFFKIGSQTEPLDT